jgi:ribonuclease III
VEAAGGFMRDLGYRFAKAAILEEAFRHSSYVNEQPSADLRDNERLEFLGDAVLNLIVGHMLMQRYPEVNEGELSRMRSQLVNEPSLAEVARGINLGAHILLGRGEEQSNGREKSSILADTFEAVIAAVYLDGGFESAFRVVDTHLSPFIKPLRHPGSGLDHKSRLQEKVQLEQQPMPVYTVIGESGPDHDKTFRVRLEVFGLVTEGVGKSKKLAEQDAAREALEHLDESYRT